MKEILKSVSKLSIPTGLNLILSLIRNKFIAVIAGPSGLGVFSQFLNLAALTSSLLPVGSLGLVNYVSKYYVDSRLDEINAILKYFIMRNLVFSFILTVIFLFLSNQISFFLFASDEHSFLVLIFAFSIPFSLVLNFVDIYFKGIRKLNNYVIFLTVNSIISIILIFPLIYYWGLNGAVLSLVVSTVFNLLLGYYILKRNNLIHRSKVRHIVDKSVIRNICLLGFGSIVTMVAQQITLLAIKSKIALSLGLDSVGEFQCVYSISASYFGIFFSLIATYSIPKVSALKDTMEIIDELNGTLKFLMIVFVPLVVTMFVSRTFIISILFSNDFLGAKELLLFQLPAELVRALSWVAGLWLIPSFKIKQWIIFDVSFYLLFYIIFFVLVEFYSFGVKAASVAYLASYVLLFFTYYLYSIRVIKFKFEIQNLKLMFISALFLITGFTLSLVNESLGYYIILPILTGWILLVVKREDYRKIVAIIRANRYLRK